MWSGISGSQTNPLFLGGANITSQLVGSERRRTRLGVAAWDRTLIYRRIGAARGHFKYDGTLTVGGIGSICDSSALETHTGWTVGTGIERAFLGGRSAKAEYSSMDLGRRTVDFAPVGPIPLNPRHRSPRLDRT